MSREIVRGKPSEIAAILKQRVTSSKDKYKDMDIVSLTAQKSKDGTAGLVKNNFVEFVGYTENPFNAEFNVCMIYDPSGYKDKVLPKLLSMEEKLGIRFYLAGRDCPLHTTVLSAKDVGEDLAARKRKFDVLQEDKGLLRYTRFLSSREFDFKNLGVLGANLILTTDCLPKEIQELRANLVNVYKSFGLEPKMLDLWHVTLARLSRVPANSGVINSYVESMAELGRELREDPLTLSGEIVLCPASRMIQPEWRHGWINPAPPSISFQHV